MYKNSTLKKKNSTLTIQCSYLVVKMHHKYSMYEIINHDSGPQGLIIFYSDTLFLLFQETLLV